MAFTFADVTAAKQFYDLLRSIASEQIDVDRPAYRYGYVTDVDYVNKRCTVRLNGEDGEKSVNFGSFAPQEPVPGTDGQIVRVEGKTGDWYITDIIDANGILGFVISAMVVDNLTVNEALNAGLISALGFMQVQANAEQASETIASRDSGGTIRFGVYPDGSAYLTKQQLGSGTFHGTNWANLTRTITASLGTGWTDCGYTNVVDLQDDDGVVFSNPNFVSQVAGFFSGNATASFTGSTTGFRAIRWITQGGTVLGVGDLNMQSGQLFLQSCSATFGGSLPGGGYTVRVQIYTSVATTLLAHAAGTPVSASFVQVA